MTTHRQFTALVDMYLATFPSQSRQGPVKGDDELRLVAEHYEQGAQPGQRRDPLAVADQIVKLRQAKQPSWLAMRRRKTP